MLELKKSDIKFLKTQLCLFMDEMSKILGNPFYSQYVIFHSGSLITFPENPYLNKMDFVDIFFSLSIKKNEDDDFTDETDDDGNGDLYDYAFYYKGIVVLFNLPGISHRTFFNDDKVLMEQNLLLRRKMLIDVFKRLDSKIEEKKQVF